MIVQVDYEANTSLVNKLALMQEAGELCDFTILVSASQIRAHKCVLAASCDYFRTSFHFSESSSEQSSAQMDLTHLGCDVKVVENVIRSFYTNHIDLDLNCLESVLQLVDYFMCESLRLCIEVFMESTIRFHTAVMYFQLAVQYRLNSTKLFSSTKWLMCFHFHDYFIYQPDTLESSMDMINAYMSYDIFQHCNPLQLMEFMLNNVKCAVERLNCSGTLSHADLAKAIRERVDNTFQKLSMLLDQVRPDVLIKWKPRLVTNLLTWRQSNLSEGQHFSELMCHVRALEMELSDHEFNVDSQCSKKNKCPVCYWKLLVAKSSKTKPEDKASVGSFNACTNPSCQSKNNPAMKDPNIGVIWAFMDDFEPDNDEYKARQDYCACTPKPVRDYLISLEKADPEMDQLLSRIKPNGHRVHGSLTAEDKPQTLSVTAKIGGQNLHWTPCQMSTSRTVKDVADSSQDTVLSSINHCDHPSTNSGEQAVSSEDCTRLVLDCGPADSQELERNILVVLAPSAEMAAQLVAVDDGQARPLLRSPKLELSYFDVEANTWCQGCKLDFPIQGAMLEKHSWRMAYLDNCLYMFSLGREIGLEYSIVERKWTNLDCRDIFIPHGHSSPVKSVIPIKVCRKLIVLSMSREAKADGTYCTQQHYFELQSESRTFVRVALVEDEKMDVPITQWTVSGNILTTVKASTMMYRNLSRIQYIHIYNAETRGLETHEVACTMESGVKVLVREHMVYLIDREGWCRSYDMRSSCWTNMEKYPYIGLSSSVGSNSEDSMYPALTRVTCHAGSSRWEITTSRKCVSGRMQQISVSADGELTTMAHPTPPFQFMTAMCPSTMSRSTLDLMDQPRFVHMDDQILDFSSYNQFEGIA